MRTDRRRRAVLALGAALLGTSGAAAAVLDLRPFAHAAYEHDDNVYRFADEAEATAQRGTPSLADTVRRVAAGTWAQLDYGRQSLRMFGELQHYDYAEFAELDRTEGQFESRYDWAYGIPWTGHVLYDHARKLEPVTSTDSADLGFQKLQEGELFVGHALTPSWQAQGGLGMRRKRHTRAEAGHSDLDEVRSRLGFAWGSALGTAGAGVEVTRGTFPNRAPADGVTTKYWQTDYLLRASSIATAVSTFETEFGYTRRAGTADGDGFTGPTGRLRYLWRWTRQATVDAQVFRRLRDIEERDANFVDEKGVAMGLTRTITRTISAVARAQYADQNYRGSPALATDGVARADQVSRIELGLTYAPRPWISLKPSFGQEQRTSNRNDREYDYAVAGLLLEVRTD